MGQNSKMDNCCCEPGPVLMKAVGISCEVEGAARDCEDFDCPAVNSLNLEGRIFPRLLQLNLKMN